MEVLTRYLVKRASPADIAIMACRLPVIGGQGGNAERLFNTCAQSRVWAARRADTGAPVALWGAAILDREAPEVGTFWMLSTDALNSDDDQIFTTSRLVVADMLETFSTLENYVDTRSSQSLNLLARLGFWVEPAFVDEGTGCLLHYVRIDGSSYTERPN